MGGCESKDHWSAADIPAQNGRVIVITGANSGIGLESVRHAAAKGANVILCARDKARGEQAAEEVRTKLPKMLAEGGATAGTISVEVLDLCSFESVKAFAKRAEAAEGPFANGIDAIILNAGVMALKDKTITGDGFETQFQTNHLGSFLLVGSILPILRRSTKTPTVVPVGSIRSAVGSLRADSDIAAWLKAESPGYGAELYYNASKQANLLFATELHKRHGSWLRVMSCHPGVSATNLFRHGYYGAFSMLFQSAEQGAMLELRAALDPTLPANTFVGTSPSYKQSKWSGHPQPEEPAPISVDPATATKLWAASEAATGISF